MPSWTYSVQPSAIYGIVEADDEDAAEWAARCAEDEISEATRDRNRRQVEPDPRPARRVLRSNAARPDRLWRERVLERDRGCCVHVNPADCSDGWQAHHVVPQQVLRREAPSILWDPRVGMGLCGLAHRRHHSRARPISYDEVPDGVAAFLWSHGFGEYLDRHYDRAFVVVEPPA